ncbi:MAG: cytochrome d ubiquinol oxidase subunit II [Gaiellaceae bacterium]|jgi:cytochrome d ubiquinol oxidase subunit II
MLASTFISLQGFWFALIGVLWAGFFVLEGFDFGVGMLGRMVGRDEAGRNAVLATIEPVWDGNEVWLIVAAGATFAAFPSWYATLFSGYYIVFFLILLGLIIRGVSIEFRLKHPSRRWRSIWDGGVLLGSAIPAFFFGLAFANVIHGVPIGANGEYSGGVLDLFGGFAVLGGFVSLAAFAFQGAVFLTLRTEGEVRGRARAAAILLAVPALLLMLLILGWSAYDAGGVDGKWIAAAVLAALAAVLLVSSLVLVVRDRDGLAFAASALALVSATAMLFVALYPRLLVSSTDPRFSLTVASSSSTHHTLALMAIVALIFTPIVLIYQGWTYWVFRARLRGEPLPGAAGSTSGNSV